MYDTIVPPGFRSNPFCFFRVPDEKKGKTGREKKEEHAESGDKNENAIRCKNCGFRICGPEQRMDRDGHHMHVFNNPAGYVFEIGCFSSAPGCAVRGEPTMEFTWFPGFAWRFALCANCFAHLGWLYLSGSGRSFYGLILANIAEDIR